MVDQKKYIQTEIMDKIWKSDVDFNNSCGVEHWLDAGNHLPIVSDMFSVNVVLYDTNKGKTILQYEVIWKTGKKEQRETKCRIVNGYNEPSTVVQDSARGNTICLLLFNGHY